MNDLGKVSVIDELTMSIADWVLKSYNLQKWSSIMWTIFGKTGQVLINLCSIKSPVCDQVWTGSSIWEDNLVKFINDNLQILQTQLPVCEWNYWSDVSGEPTH